VVVTAALTLIVAGSWVIGAFSAERTTTAAPMPVPTSVVPVPVWTDPPPAPVPAEAVATAATWVRAFLVRPGQTREQWLARLDPLTSDEYLGVLATEADDHEAPQVLTGPAAAVDGAAGSADVDVPTDRGVVRVQLVEEDGRWLVAEADPTGGAR
jgi:hypothetical protein